MAISTQLNSPPVVVCQLDLHHFTL